MVKNNIICINFNNFKNYKEFSKFIDKSENLRKIYTGSDFSNTLSYESVFNKLSKVWILDNYIMYIQHKGSDEMIINPELEKIILEKSTEINNIVEETKVEIILDMDSILDRINDVGVDGLTLEEKDFLNKQN
jgi:hypothetical protein|tara:strand:- start:221 stop:619 length:399 start_codon:yes stop_codon:yes gene_type:complete